MQAKVIRAAKLMSLSKLSKIAGASKIFSTNNLCRGNSAHFHNLFLKPKKVRGQVNRKDSKVIFAPHPPESIGYENAQSNKKKKDWGLF